MGLFDFLNTSKVRSKIKKEVLQSLDVREREQRMVAQNFIMRHFQSSNESRRRPGWDMFSLSADAELLHVLPTMRARSRLLVDNDAKAGGLVLKEISNVIGPSISVQAKIPPSYLKAQPLQSERVKDVIDNAEYFWREKVAKAGSKDLDWRRTRTFLQYMRLAFRHAKVDGGVFLRFSGAVGRSIPFQCRIIEPECIGTPPSLQNRDNIVGGIQFKSSGELDGYWVAMKHPYGLAGSIEYEFVSARNEFGLPQMVFFFDPHRESASREIPWLQRALVLLNDVADYKDSELQRKKLEADIAWFFKLNNPDKAQTTMEGDTAFGGDNTNTSKRSTVANPKRLVHYLEQNEDLQVVNSDRPGANYEKFLISHDRDIGLGIGRSFERVSNNYGAANFSATRVSGIEDFVEYEIEFNLFAESILTPIWEWAMWALSMSLGDPVYRQVEPRWQRYVKPSWDPNNDADAAVKRMEGNVQSVVEEAGKIGADWETVQDNKLKAELREQEERKRLGLEAKSDSKNGKQNPPKSTEDANVQE